MKDRLIYIYIGIYFLSLGYTKTIGTYGSSGILGRVTYSDFLLLPIFLFALVNIFNSGKISITRPQKTYFAFLLLALISIIWSVNQTKAMFELIVLLFSFSIFLSFYQLFKNSRFQKKIIISNIWFYVSGAVAVISIIDFAFYQLFPRERGAGGLTAGFRNTGQAGTFFSVSIILGFSLFYSGLIKGKYLAYLVFFFMTVALVLTVKRAALLGVFAGFTTFYLLGSILIRDDKIASRLISLFIMLFSFSILYFIFMWGVENIEGMSWRYNKKIGEHNFQDTSFLMEQIHNALTAFSERPLLGVSLSGVRSFLNVPHEVHNGYLKILATTGTLGFILFSVFYLQIFQALRKTSHLNPDIKKFSNTIYFMLIGFSVSWGYSYPLRKREFWLFLAIIFILTTSKKYTKK